MTDTKSTRGTTPEHDSSTATRDKTPAAYEGTVPKGVSQDDAEAIAERVRELAPFTRSSRWIAHGEPFSARAVSLVLGADDINGLTVSQWTDSSPTTWDVTRVGGDGA